MASRCDAALCCAKCHGEHVWCVQEMMAAQPPQCAGLGLVHAVDPDASEAGVAYLHTPAPLHALQAVNALCPCRMHLHAAPAHTAYVLPFGLSSDLVGAYAMKSRRNLPRSSQG
jgi:hypothetical protein